MWSLSHVDHKNSITQINAKNVNISKIILLWVFASFLLSVKVSGLQQFLLVPSVSAMLPKQHSEDFLTKGFIWTKLWDCNISHLSVSKQFSKASHSLCIAN